MSCKILLSPPCSNNNTVWHRVLEGVVECNRTKKVELIPAPDFPRIYTEMGKGKIALRTREREGKESV